MAQCTYYVDRTFTFSVSFKSWTYFLVIHILTHSIVLIITLV